MCPDTVKYKLKFDISSGEIKYPALEIFFFLFNCKSSKNQGIRKQFKIMHLAIIDLYSRRNKRKKNLVQKKKKKRN